MGFHQDWVDGELWLMYGPYKVSRLATSSAELFLALEYKKGPEPGHPGLKCINPEMDGEPDN